MTDEFALWLAIGAGVLAVLYGLVSAQWILKQPAGNERMQEIAQAIQEGANAYMNRQYFAIGIVGVVLLATLFVVLGSHTAIGFCNRCNTVRTDRLYRHVRIRSGQRTHRASSNRGC